MSHNQTDHDGLYCPGCGLRLPERLEGIVAAATTFVSAFSGNKVAQLGNGAARKAYQQFALLLGKDAK